MDFGEECATEKDCAATWRVASEVSGVILQQSSYCQLPASKVCFYSSRVKGIIQETWDL